MLRIIGITQGSVVAVSVTSKVQVHHPETESAMLWALRGAARSNSTLQAAARGSWVRKQVVSRLDELVVDHWQPA
jgi:hypothetical protein